MICLVDYWPLPWMLYGAESVRVLGTACLAVIAIGFSGFRREKPDRGRVAADLGVGDLP